MTLHMTNAQAMKLALLASVAALLAAALFLPGCAPPLVLPPVPVSPPKGDPPPTRPPEALTGTLARIEAIQARCWWLRLEWHHTRGWVCWAKEDTGGIGSETDWVEAPTLDQALRELTKSSNP